MKIFLLLLSLALVSYTMLISKHQVQINHDKSCGCSSCCKLRKIDYPVRMAYINRIGKWWPPTDIAASLGVPDYAPKTQYNYLALAFWSCNNGPLDAVSIWADPVHYLGNNSEFGTTKDEIQKKLRKHYHEGGVRILVSAFGATQFPTTAQLDAEKCAIKLAKFINQNHLDGADIDWEDNPAMQLGKGQEWIITFTKKLRKCLKNHIITHAPQAPYFKQQHYKNGGYVTVNDEVGDLIDFYNVQFYNQGNTQYSSFKTLFLQSGGYFSGTSVQQIADRGVPLEKIIVGKPVKAQDAMNTGLIKSDQFGKYVNQAYKQLGWYAGVMYWQYFSDSKGENIKAAADSLWSTCLKDKKCKMISLS